MCARPCRAKLPCEPLLAARPALRRAPAQIVAKDDRRFAAGLGPAVPKFKESRAALASVDGLAVRWPSCPKTCRPMANCPMALFSMALVLDERPGAAYQIRTSYVRPYADDNLINPPRFPTFTGPPSNHALKAALPMPAARYAHMTLAYGCTNAAGLSSVLRCALSAINDQSEGWCDAGGAANSLRPNPRDAAATGASALTTCNRDCLRTYGLPVGLRGTDFREHQHRIADDHVRSFAYYREALGIPSPIHRLP